MDQVLLKNALGIRMISMSRFLGDIRMGNITFGSQLLSRAAD